MSRLPRWLALVARPASLAAVLLCPAPALAAPVEEFLNRPVASVRLVQEGQPLDEPTLLEVVETRVGRPLSLAEVRETIAHLIGLGRFQDVRVSAALAESGVALTYDLIPLRAVGRLDFRGALGLSESRLRSTIVDRFGVSPAPGRAEEMTEALVALYGDYGYQRAAVTVSVEVERKPDRLAMIFAVDAGPRAAVRNIAIDGTPPVPRAALIDWLGLSAGDPFARPEMLQGIARIIEDLRASGYYEARVNHGVQFTADGRFVDVAVAIEAGPRVVVAFQGDPLPDRRRDELVPVRREGSVDEDLLEDAKRGIETYLRGEGYRDAVADIARSGDNLQQRIVISVTRGPRYVVSAIDFDGARALTPRELDDLVRLDDGDPFVQTTLDAAVGRVAEEYRRRGFAGVTVKADAAPAAAKGQAGSGIPVHIRLAIAEGVRSVVGEITFTGNQALTAEALRAALSLRPGEPYYAPRMTADLDALILLYLNDGYQTASADAKVEFNPDRTRADLRFAITEGPQVFVDHILIVGNTRTRAEIIQRELAVKAGQPLNFSDIVESQRRLSALGLFRRVRISELRHAGSITRRDLLVTIEEAPLTTIGYGVGIEAGRRLRRTEEEEGAVEVFEAAPRGFFEIGRRNLWGKNRSINLFMRVSLREREAVPVESPSPDPDAPASSYGFNEYRVLGTFREPKIFGTQADALVTGFVEQAVRSSFNFNRRGVRAEIGRRLTRRLSFAGRYAFDRTRLFDERINPADRPDIDRLFPGVRLSSFSSSLIHDTRDDAIEPADGALVGIDGELAARAIGSEVGFTKTFVQAFFYRRVPRTQRVIFAGGARLGLATGFPRTLARTDENDQPVLDEDGNPIVDEVRDLPASERFFAGGDTTVRGFALDRLGRPDTFDSDGFPKGGHALMIFNAEVRVPVWRDLGAVGFVDAGNVFALVDDLDLTRLRGGAGFGIRYKSPIGPLRIDLGFKLNRERFANGQLERRTALHISLGQAF